MHTLLFNLIYLLIMLLSYNALGDYESDPLGSTLCLFLFYIRHNVTKAVAILGVIVFGLRALRGSISWQTAMLIIVGITIIMKTDDIMRFLHDIQVIDIGAKRLVCDAPK